MSQSTTGPTYLMRARTLNIPEATSDLKLISFIAEGEEDCDE